MAIVDLNLILSHKKPANGANTPFPTNMEKLIRLDTRSEISDASMWDSSSVPEVTMSGKAGTMDKAIPTPTPNTPKRVPNNEEGIPVKPAGPTIIKESPIIKSPEDIFVLYATWPKNLFETKTVKG